MWAYMFYTTISRYVYGQKIHFDRNNLLIIDFKADIYVKQINENENLIFF